MHATNTIDAEADVKARGTSRAVATAEENAAIEVHVELLHKSFSGREVLRGIDFDVPRGQMLAIVGNSGSGKTVLLEHVIGQLRPDQGRVCLADHESDGAPLTDLSTLDDNAMDRIRIHWGVVFQRNALLSGSVYENISLPLILVKGLSEDEARQKAREVLEEVGLKPDETLEKKRDELSGGMEKRVAIARALAMDPLLLLYDEPTTALDPEHAKLVQDLIAKTHRAHEKDGGKHTSLIVTHDKDLLYRLRPRVLMLREGQVSFDGSYEEFQKRSDSKEIRPYFELMPGLHLRPTARGRNHR